MKKKVIIVGGGFGGLETALSLWYLLKSSVAITLIDRSVYHSFIPSIHDVVSGTVRPRDIQIPLLLVLSPTDIHFVQDEVVSVDPVTRQVMMTRTGAMEFDYLVLSSGAENNFFGVTGAEEFSHRFRSPEDAELIYSDVSELLKEGKNRCNLIVAGGGAEGVEVAGELIDLVKEGGYEKDLVSGRISVEVIDKARLLTAFPPKAMDFVEEYLSRLGVKVFTGSPIVEVQKDKVVLESGVHRDMSILIWAGGIQPSKIIQGLPLSKDAQGWLKVTDRLHSPDNERIYGVGDIISVSGEGGPVAVPRLAYHALDQARIASLNIYSHIQGRRSIGYVPKPKLQLVSIGKHMGILMQGERVVTGPSVVLLKKMVQMRHLMTYLTKPALSAISSKLPGAELRHPLRFIKWFLPI